MFSTYWSNYWIAFKILMIVSSIFTIDIKQTLKMTVFSHRVGTIVLKYPFFQGWLREFNNEPFKFPALWSKSEQLNGYYESFIVFWFAYPLDYFCHPDLYFYFLQSGWLLSCYQFWPHLFLINYHIV